MNADPHVRALNLSRVYLVKNISDVVSILDHLKSATTTVVLTTDHYETIKSEKTDSNKVRMLLDILAKRTPRAAIFDAFCDALDSTENVECVKVLRDNLAHVTTQTSTAQVNPAPAAGFGPLPAFVPPQASLVPIVPNGQEWLSEADDTRMVEETELADICAHVGNIDLLRIRLGFSEAHLAQVRMANPYYPANQVLKLLCDWRSQHYRAATVAKLVKILRSSGVADDTLREVFLKKPQQAT